MGISQKNENCQRQKNRQQTSPRRTKNADCINNSCHFPKSARILSSRHFQGLLRERSRISGACISIDYRRGRALRPRLGITVSKKFGKAHDRNRFKRVIREFFRTSSYLFPRDLEINVSPRLSSKNLVESAILEEMKLLLAKVP